MTSTYIEVMEWKFFRILALLPAIQGLPPSPRDIIPGEAVIHLEAESRGTVESTWVK